MPKSKATIKLVFDVTGYGPFPLDMLRYDCCFPASEEDSARMERTFNRRARDEATITLRYVSEYKPKGPTDARWRSFGWRVEGQDF